MFTLISSALLALAPCLAAQSVTAQDLPDAVLAQVPADAALCYRIESLDALDAMLATLFSLYPERAGDAISVDTLLAQMPELDASAVDRTRPLFAYMTSLDLSGVAPIYAFVPALDPAALIAALPTGAPLHAKQLADQYVAITNNQKGFPEVSTPSALPRLLNGSTFSAALELDGAMRQQVAFAIFVLTMTKSKMVGDLGLNEDLPTVMRDAMIDAGTLMFDQVIEFVGEVGQLTFSMDLADTVLDLDLGFLMKPDAVMGRQALPARTPVGSLAPAVDPKAMLSLVFNMDFGGWIAANKPMLEKGLMDFLGETKPLPEEVPLGWGGTEEFMDGVHEALVNGLDLLACLRKNVVLQTNSLEDLQSIKVLTTGTDLATLTAAAQLIASSDLLKVMGFSLQAEPRGDQQTRFSFGFDPAVFSKSFDMQSTSNQGILESIGAALSQPFEWSMTDQQGLVGVEFQRSRPQGPSRSRALDLAVAHIDETPLLFLAHINYGKFFAENPSGLIVGESAAELTQTQLDAIARIDLPTAAFVTFNGDAAHVGLTADLKQLPTLIEIIQHPPQPPTAEELADFNASVLPIFEAKCTDCHGERRQREGLRLDSLDALRIGSEHGAVIQPGDAANSLLYQLISSPLDDDDHMPPSKKPQPSAEDIAAIQAWILRQS